MCSVTVDATWAISRGLILNELLVNALEHGPRAGEPLEVMVVLQTSSSGEIHLRVEDDGVGLRPGFDIAASTSLGLRLVQALCRQLQGSFRLSGERGCRADVRATPTPQ